MTVMHSQFLTNCPQVDNPADFRLIGRHLTFVISGIVVLHRADLQSPSVRSLNPLCLEPVVTDECVVAYGQQVAVSFAYPGYLV